MKNHNGDSIIVSPSLRSRSCSRYISSYPVADTATMLSTYDHHHHHHHVFDSGPLHDKYYELISSDTIDPIQIRTVQSLERLRYEILQQDDPTTIPTTTTTTDDTAWTLPIKDLTKWTGWMGFSSSSSSSSSSHEHQSTQQPPTIRGVYIHGGVGCGKTFLMNDIFYNSIKNDSSTIWSKHIQKVHFHTFMLQVHQQMHIARQEIIQQQQQQQQQNCSIHHHQQQHHESHNNGNSGGDMILDKVVTSIVQHGRIICFDEFQVTDVADALLLQRLFTKLWLHPNNCIIIATSNRKPDDLYLNGLQRDRFIPFIQQLKVFCESVSMWESEHDYRLVLKQQDEYDQTTSDIPTTTNVSDNLNGNTPNSYHSIPTRMRSSRVYFVGGKEVWKNYDRFFYHLVGKNKAVTPTTLQTQGRKVYIPQASLSKGICRFTFESLCTKALGAADYLVLGQHFHTVFVEYIPILKLEHINWVRRFIIFVDTMYECNCKLILHAKTSPNDIFQTGLNEDEIAATQIDEVFAFQRTVSRLHEMSSQTYLQKQQKLHPTTMIDDDNDIDSTTRVESKASLLSHRKAFVNYSPS